MASDGTIKISTELDSSQAKSAMSKFSSFSKTAMAGVAVAVGTASAAMGAMAGYSIKVGSSFESGMSKVSAISGATGDELDALTDKAKEMGAKTKFSASEAADAFQYMAMAGWKTSDMLDGIEGIMNLAAASGEDLATTSDIVTDALTAFGLSASDSAHFADILAQASSNSNTNVSMMGETFKYVAPVAGALGFSAEDCAVAIGLMANSGIKASQAGTSLRQLFTNLVKPTDNMKTAMDELGISITDTDGNTKSLDTVMGDLRQSFSGLSESQKAQYAATLAGQEGMSGLLAIVNASDGDFASLKSSINNADGAAEKMAETMNDNLKGSITIAGSALEGFGISVYEKMEAPLKSAVDKGTEYINRMADAFKADGLNGVVEEAGKIFNDACDDVSDFGGAAEGVIEPIRKIVNTGTDLAKDVLPKVRSGIEFTAKNLDVLAPVVLSSVAAFKAFSAIGKVTATQTKLNAAAMATLTKMDKANALQLVATNGGLSARQILLAVSNGQMTAGTAVTSLFATAQAKLNAVLAANPLGAIVAGGMALFGVYKALEAATERQTEVDKEEARALKEASKAAEEHAKASKERLDSYNELVESQNTQAASDLNQLNNLKDLNTELQNIVDENGKVKEGYEDRAAFITSQLSSALGVEISMTDGQIENYQELEGKIQDLIQTKRIEAVMSAQQAKYDEAVANQMDAAREATESYNGMLEARNKLSKEQAELGKLQDQLDDARKRGDIDTIKVLQNKMETQAKVRDSAKETYETEMQAYNDSKDALAKYANDIDQYTALAEAAASGNSEAIEQAIANITAGIKTASNATADELQKQVIAVSDTEEMIRQEVANGTPGFTEEMLKQAQQATNAALEEFAKAAPASAEELAKVPPEAVAALIAGDLNGQLSSEAKGAVDGMLDQFDGMDKKTKKKFANAVYGALEGLDGFDGKLKDPAKEGVDAFLESLRSALDEHSPSKKTEEIFKLAMEGAANGVDSGKENLLTKAGEVITEFLGKFSSDEEGGFGEKMQQAGASLMAFFGLGVSSKKEDSKNAGLANAEAAKSGAAEVNPNATGRKFGTRYISGIGKLLRKTTEAGRKTANAAKSGAGSVDPSGTGGTFGNRYAGGVGGTTARTGAAGRRIANHAKSGAGAIDPSGTGRSFGSSYASGIGDRTGAAEGQGRTLAINAKSGAGSYDGYEPGSNFGQGFVLGIADWIGAAARKAAELGKSAYEAAKRAIDSRSPSKKTKKLGKWFGQGFEIGIEGEEQSVEKAAETISEAALDALDTEVLIDKLKGLNASELMDKAYAASNERRSYVADKVMAAVAPAQNLKWKTQEQRQNVQLSEDDIKRLASAFAKAASNSVVKEMEGMSIQTKEREWARLVREVKG